MAASIYYSREASQKCKIPHSKLIQGEYLFPEGSTYLIVNQYF